LIFIKKKKKFLKFFLQNNPQKKGIVFFLKKKNPKKPNSANRSIIIFFKNKFFSSFIPGIGHNLKKFFFILISFYNVKDLPNIKLFNIRGKYDLNGVKQKINSRSFYGTSLKKKTFY
jgi:small subunit ribosomal protein S12